MAQQYDEISTFQPMTTQLCNFKYSAALSLVERFVDSLGLKINTHFEENGENI